jgi:hypothetical protein
LPKPHRIHRSGGRVTEMLRVAPQTGPVNADSVCPKCSIKAFYALHHRKFTAAVETILYSSTARIPLFNQRTRKIVAVIYHAITSARFCRK